MAKKKSTSNYRGNRFARVFAAVIAGLLAFVMIASLVMGALSARAASQAHVNELKQQLTTITQQKEAASAKVASLKNQRNSILQEIEQIDTQIAAAEEELELQQALIDELNVMIADKEIELAASQTREEEQYRRLRERVRVMYEHGSTSYLAILLSADNFNDFLSRYEVVSQISAYDHDLLQQLKAIKEEIAEQKASLESDKYEAEGVKASMESNKKALEDTLSERQARMDEIAAAEAAARAEYADIAREEDSVSAAIKKEAAELAAQAAAAAKAQSAASTYVGGSFQWPLPASNNVVTCRYGMRTHPITGVYKLHSGVDLRATSGTNVYAANSGTVTRATYSSAYGNYVMIDHGGGVVTLYGHMKKLAVSKGQTVRRGQVIGYVGSTGYSTAPHLHFEIIKNAKYTNPLNEFPGFKVIYK